RLGDVQVQIAMKTRLLIPLIALVSLFGSFHAKRAHAQNVEVYLQVRPADPADKKERGHAPKIEATIVGGSKTTVDKFSLSTTNNGQKVTVKAEKLRDYSEGTETIAIALVINGQEIWIGNDEIETDPNSQYPG